MRVAVQWRSASKDNYRDFCTKYPNIKLPFDKWKQIIYNFNEGFREYVLETGDRARYPSGMGEFSIIKKKRATTKERDGKTYINLPIDWVKTRQKGKKIYFMNYHTEGYFFGWKWFKPSASIKFSDIWMFKPSRITSRLLSHYLKVNDKYQHMYKEWLYQK
jgi:hypothetical protein